MKPRISIITIGVDDLDRALIVYRDGLGFPTRGIVGMEYEHGAVAFFASAWPEDGDLVPQGHGS